MKVSYLGPMLVCRDHPAIQEMPVSDLPATCFLVEASDEAGVGGEIAEGDVLVADENRAAEFGDVVLACNEFEEMHAYHASRAAGRLHLVPVGGGESVPAAALDCVGVVVRRARRAGDVDAMLTPEQTTLAEAFFPWFKLSTWCTPNPADARRFHECCEAYLQSGRSMRAYGFAEALRVAISKRNGGRWDDYCEQALQRRAQCAEAISEFMHDTHQVSR